MIHPAVPYKIAALTFVGVGATLEVVALQQAPTMDWVLANATVWIAIGGGFAMFGGLRKTVQTLEATVKDKAEKEIVHEAERRSEKRFDELKRMIEALEAKIDLALPPSVRRLKKASSGDFE